MALRRLADAEAVRSAVAGFSPLEEDRPRLEGRWRTRRAPGRAHPAVLEQLDEIARAGRARSPLAGAAALWIEGERLRMQGETERADRIESAVASAGLALGDAARRERVLASVDAAIRAGDLAGARAALGRQRTLLAVDGRGGMLEAMLLERVGRRTEALDRIARAAASGPTDPSPHFEHGAMARRAGRDDESRRAFERCLQIDPFHVEALVAAAEGALARRDLGTFDEAIRRLRAISPSASDARPRSCWPRGAHCGRASTDALLGPPSRPIPDHDRRRRHGPRRGAAWALFGVFGEGSVADRGDAAPPRAAPEARSDVGDDDWTELPRWQPDGIPESTASDDTGASASTRASTPEELEPCPDAWRKPIRLFADGQVRPRYQHRTMLGVEISGVTEEGFLVRGSASTRGISSPR